MRTGTYDALSGSLDDAISKVIRLSGEVEVCREENRILVASLDRCKDATAAVIEQREELARRIREGRR